MIGTILGAYGQQAMLQRVTSHLDEHGEVVSESIVETAIRVHIWREREQGMLEVPGVVSPSGLFALVRPEVEVAPGDYLVLEGVKYKMVDRQPRRFGQGSVFYQVLGLSRD